MEKLYKIENDYAEIFLNTKIYPIIAVKKALINYIEEMYIKLDYKDNETLKIQIVSKGINKNDLEETIGNIYNDLLNETLRYQISIETKNLRELIVGRALYTTCIETEENELENKKNQDEEEYNLNDIAINWFDKNENNEE